ncbi:WhiB family transcriptional regulator [Streptomyces noursei]|uniref:WhiB family transcriptional regulator n=1 Tax=Streptomyces noursei TaxID=1971 RepID=UPI0009A08FBA
MGVTSAWERTARTRRRDDSGGELDPQWWIQARCKRLESDLFFDSRRETEALEVCKPCSVRTECLAQALDKRTEYGVFGGTTALWRKQLLLRRADVTSWHAFLSKARARHRHQQLRRFINFKNSLHHARSLS